MNHHRRRVLAGAAVLSAALAGCAVPPAPAPAPASSSSSSEMTFPQVQSGADRALIDQRQDAVDRALAFGQHERPFWAIPITSATLADPEVLALRHYSTVSSTGAVQIAQELNTQLLAEDGFALTGMRVDHNEGQIFIACQQQSCQEVPAP